MRRGDKRASTHLNSADNMTGDKKRKIGAAAQQEGGGTHTVSVDLRLYTKETAKQTPIQALCAIVHPTAEARVLICATRGASPQSTFRRRARRS
jgi:hypothetical protein